MDVNEGKVIKCFAGLKKMVGLTCKNKKKKKKKESQSEEEAVSDPSPQPVHCDELFLESEKPEFATNHILRSHIIAQNYFSQKPNICL